MNFWALSLSFKSAGIEERSRALLSGFSEVKNITQGLDEFVSIMTCNRVEIFGVGEVSPEEVLKKWAEYRDLSSELQAKFQSYQNFQALIHLYRVTSSLDSMVVGENQIHGQVKKSYLKAQEEGSAGSVLHKIFQSAFRCAKRVRSETELGAFAVSVPSIGVKLAQKVLGTLNDKKIGILGVGEIGRVAAEHFGSIAPKELLLFNRTTSKLDELVNQFKREKVPAKAVHDLDQILKESQVIVSCVDTCLISDELVSKIGEDRFPSFILDLSVPSSVRIKKFENILVYSVDDLQRIAEENSYLRRKELNRAHQILFDEAEKIWSSFSSQSVDQTFQRLSAKIDDIRDRELEALRKKLSHLSEEDWAEVVKATRRVGQKIMQDPVMVLKSQAKIQGEGETWLHFFRNVFKI